MPHRFCCLVVLTAVVSVTCGVRATASDEPPPSEEQLFGQANARIEKYRKADAIVTVIDNRGNAVGGAKIQVEQTQHAFLFGCNIFMWGRAGDEKGEAEYRRRFADVFNFATLPFYWWTYEPRIGEPIHDKTEAVEFSLRERPRRQQPCQYHKGGNPDRHVDVENPAPVQCLGQQATQHRADQRSDHHRHTPDGHDRRLLARAAGIKQDRLAHGAYEARAGALHRAKKHHLR